MLGVRGRCSSACARGCCCGFVTECDASSPRCSSACASGCCWLGPRCQASTCTCWAPAHAATRGLFSLSFVQYAAQTVALVLGMQHLGMLQMQFLVYSLSQRQRQIQYLRGMSFDWLVSLEETGQSMVVSGLLVKSFMYGRPPSWLKLWSAPP